VARRSVKIPYYVVKGGRAYWQPTKAMRDEGYAAKPLGAAGEAAEAEALALYHQWLKAAEPAKRVWPRGSIGEGWERWRRTATWLGKPERTREEWERVWSRIEPFFGNLPPGAMTLELVEEWYAFVREGVSLREAHRCIKIWRALWRVLASMHYCERDGDPSLAIRNKTPPPRQHVWTEGEVARLVKQAWRMGYRGLACILAVAWDGMLSPVDARELTADQMRREGRGLAFALGRAKTGRAAAVVLTARSARLVRAYLDPWPIGPVTLFKTRGYEPGEKGGRPRAAVPYTKDHLVKDFATVRAAVFPGDKRAVIDFRRSGAVEAVAGEVDPLALSSAMANDIAQARELQKTYVPVDATLVKAAADARKAGRRKLRARTKEGDKLETEQTPVGSQPAKPLK
jgi:hypothetical protein